MRNGDGSLRGREVRKCAEWNFGPMRRVYIDVLERIGTLAVSGIHLHHHVILVLCLVHYGHLPLSERVVQRVVDGHRRNTQAGGGLPIDHHVGGEAMVLLVTGDVAKFRHSPHLCIELRCPFQQVLQVVTLEGVLELRVALASTDVHVLHGHKE